MENMGTMMAILTGIGVFFGMILLYTVATTLQICEPSEVMIISGRSSMVGGRKVGYSPCQGWAIKWPVIEKVHKLDLRNMTISVTCKDAFSKEGVPLTVEGVANLKISSRQPLLNNAVERFMGMPRAMIMKIAQETLEGNLRGVLATMTPEQVNHDKMLFAQSLVEEADKDLQRLGLELDNLKIQSVRDDEGYLDCLGRQKQAAQREENRLAEEENREAAGVREAENKEKRVVAELESKMRVVQANASTKVADAVTKRDAVVAKEKAKVDQEIARAGAEIEVYKALIEQTRNRLDADVLQPAEAAKEKALAEARAQVAPIRESGRATAKMLDDLTAAWKAAGPRAREVFRMQKMDGFLDTLVGTLPSLKVSRLTMVGAGAGAGAGGAGLPSQALRTYETVRGALGSDPLAAVASGVRALAAGDAGRSVSASAPAELDFGPEDAGAQAAAAPEWIEKAAAAPAPTRARPATPLSVDERLRRAMSQRA